MASKIMRRSGNAVVEYLGLVGFTPARVFMAGVGGHHEEVMVMRETWPDIELFGWEPNPKTCQGLIGKFPGRLYEAALWSKTGSLRLNFRSNWKDGSSIFRPIDDAGWHSTAVKSEALDDVLIDSNTNALLWLDCEGGEAEVIKGGRKFINENVVAINCEMTCKPRMPDWPIAYEVHDLLMDLGFFQAWVHSIRPSIGQFDAVYLRREQFDPLMSCCMDSVSRWTRPEVLSCP